MLGTAYLVDYACYTLCIMYACRGIYKVHNKSWLNDLNGEDNVSRGGRASIPPYTDWIYWFTKTLCNDYIVNLQINVNNDFHQ